LIVTPAPQNLAQPATPNHLISKLFFASPLQPCIITPEHDMNSCPPWVGKKTFYYTLGKFVNALPVKCFEQIPSM
jgi:hypothetical protein